MIDIAQHLILYMDPVIVDPNRDDFEKTKNLFNSMRYKVHKYYLSERYFMLQKEKNVSQIYLNVY